MTSHFFNSPPLIIAWLDKYEIKNYQLLADPKYGFVVNVHGSVNLEEKNLETIPVKFNCVIKDFSVFKNKLTDLDFAPNEVGGNFSCDFNNLISLKGSPHSVGGSFYCSNNRLVSLEFMPKIVAYDIVCAENKLSSLQFLPTKVGGILDCSYNQITSLEYVPSHIEEILDLRHNLIASLEFFPEMVVGGAVFLRDNESLGDIQYNNNFDFLFNCHREIKIKKEKESLTTHIIPQKKGLKVIPDPVFKI